MYGEQSTKEFVANNITYFTLIKSNAASLNSLGKGRYANLQDAYENGVRMIAFNTGGNWYKMVFTQQQYTQLMRVNALLYDKEQELLRQQQQQEQFETPHTR